MGMPNLTGVLVATVRNPSSRAPAPDWTTASSAKETTASGGQPRTQFSRPRGDPTGDRETGEKIVRIAPQVILDAAAQLRARA
jgi:hypothetical protein